MNHKKTVKQNMRSNQNTAKIISYILTFEELTLEEQWCIKHSDYLFTVIIYIIEITTYQATLLYLSSTQTVL